MNPDQYRRIWEHWPPFSHLPPKEWDQSLILPEIIACLHPHESVWLPFYEDFTAHVLAYLGHEVYGMEDVPDKSTAVYFGTPTIVDGKALFPAQLKVEAHKIGTVGKWDKDTERNVVRAIVDEAERFDYRIIISGLGTGDISVEERLDDMGGGRVVCFKHFAGFTDHVLVRELRDG